jgi:hypothetical protein
MLVFLIRTSRTSFSYYDPVNNITCMRDLQDGFWIGRWDLLHLIHSYSSELQATQCYRYSTNFQFTVTHALGFSVFICRFLAMDLSQSHCNLRSQVKSFTVYFLSCNYSAIANSDDSTQFHCSAPQFVSWQAGIPKLDSSLHYCSLFLSYRTLLLITLHELHGKHSLLLSRMRVYWPVT